MEEYFELLETLIRNRAVSADTARVISSVQTVRDFLASKGVQCLTEVEARCGRRCLWAANTPDKNPDVLFCVHLDVVPAISPEQYQPRREGDRLIGRGAVDDLGNALMALKVLVALKDSPLTIGVLCSSDEELGGFTVADMLQAGYSAKRLAIIADAAPYSIITREKGIIILHAAAHGHAAHASMPWEGVNAADILLEDYAELRRRWLARQQASPEDQWHNSIQLCQINAGNAENQIPEDAKLVLNIRYTDAADRDKIIAEVKDAMPRCEISEPPARSCLPVFVDEQLPLMQSLLAAMQASFPDKGCKFTSTCFATDARHLTGLGVPILIIGVEGAGAHAVDEWVSLNSIKEYADWLISALPEVLVETAP